MPLGLFQADRFSNACLPKLSEVGPDRRVEVGVGRVAVGFGQVGPVIEGRRNQGVRTGHDRLGHRCPDRLNVRWFVDGSSRCRVVVDAAGR